LFRTFSKNFFDLWRARKRLDKLSHQANYPDMFRRILSMVGLGSETTDPEVFTREALEIFQRQSGAVKIERAGPLEFTVTMPDSTTQTVHLDNLFQTCLANPKRKEEEIARFARIFLNGPAAETILPKNVVPLVRDRALVAELEESIGKRTEPGKPKPELMFEPLGADLVIMYVADNPETIQYLSREDVKEIHLSGQTLKELALENLRRILPDVKSQGANGLFFFSADNCYEPSLVLSDRLWEKFRSEVKGDILFGIPARGALFVADSAEPDAVAQLMKMTREIYAQQPYRISDKIYVRHPDRITFYNPEQQTLTT
jgi:hypothetical protein